jgi:hypothetical protein
MKQLPAHAPRRAVFYARIERLYEALLREASQPVCVLRRSADALEGGLAGRMRPRDYEARQPASQCEYAVLYFQPSLLRPGLPRQLLLRCRNRFG